MYQEQGGVQAEEVWWSHWVAEKKVGTLEDMGREGGKERTRTQGQGQLGLGIKAWR